MNSLGMQSAPSPDEIQSQRHVEPASEKKDRDSMLEKKDLEKNTKKRKKKDLEKKRPRGKKNKTAPEVHSGLRPAPEVTSIILDKEVTSAGPEVHSGQKDLEKIEKKSDEDDVEKYIEDPKKNSKSRFWFITEHKVETDHKQLAKGMVWKNYQHEICPKTGKEHLQIFVVYKTSTRFSKVKKDHTYTEGGCPHIQQFIGPKLKGRNYCRKAETRKPGTVPVEIGEWEEGQQGKRSDLEIIADKIKNNATIATIAEEHPGSFMRYNQGIREYKNAIHKEKTTTVTVWVFLGPPGCGKDLFVKYLTRTKKAATIHLGTPEWWAGYNGQDIIHLEDYKAQLPFRTALVRFDHYDSQMIPVKGSHVHANWSKIFITTNRHPREWYPNVKDYSALERRIETLFIYNKERNSFEESPEHRQARNKTLEQSGGIGKQGKLINFKIDIPKWKKELGIVDEPDIMKEFIDQGETFEFASDEQVAACESAYEGGDEFYNTGFS